MEVLCAYLPVTVLKTKNQIITTLKNKVWLILLQKLMKEVIFKKISPISKQKSKGFTSNLINISTIKSKFNNEEKKENIIKSISNNWLNSFKVQKEEKKIKTLKDFGFNFSNQSKCNHEFNKLKIRRKNKSPSKRKSCGDISITTRLYPNGK